MTKAISAHFRLSANHTGKQMMLNVLAKQRKCANYWCQDSHNFNAATTYVAVYVRFRFSVRVIFSITWYVPDTATYVWQVAASYFLLVPISLRCRNSRTPYLCARLSKLGRPLALCTFVSRGKLRTGISVKNSWGEAAWLTNVQATSPWAHERNIQR